MKKLKATNINLTEEQFEELRKIAYERRISLSEAVREAVEAYLENIYTVDSAKDESISVPTAF